MIAWSVPRRLGGVVATLPGAVDNGPGNAGFRHVQVPKATLMTTALGIRRSEAPLQNVDCSAGVEGWVMFNNERGT
jgi:hypothetical protein